MPRWNNSTLLVPLMALLALIYPFALSRQQASMPGGPAARHSGEPVGDHGAAKGGENKDEHTAKAILAEFFGNESGQSNESSDSYIRRNYQLDFLIFTVPDPVDSHLPYLFDRDLTALQRAAESEAFVLDRFDLPWLDEIRARAATHDSESSSNVGSNHDHHHEYMSQPGFLLFTRPKQENPSRQPTALLVFLVGETPTTGIHKQAMLTALGEISELCSYQLAHHQLAPKTTDSDQRVPQPSDCNSVRILGPSFSGSAQSLDFALHTWAASLADATKLPRIRIVSGSATAVPVCGDLFRFSKQPVKPKDWNDPKTKDDPPYFSATVVRDQTALNFMLNFLKESRRDITEPLRVALLTEGNTAYGSSLRETLRKSRMPGTAKTTDELGSGNSCKQPQAPVVTPVDLPFPLHISRLRSESERARKQRQAAEQNPQDLSSSYSLPLPTEDDSGEAKDSVPSVSQLDISASELMLSDLLSAISREQFQYVGIAATDVRDVIFLAREIREHSPSTVIFALNADLIYTHPEAYPDTRGMLVATPYPLFALNQGWMNPVTPEAGGQRIQFPDQNSEGIYNAALYLLKNDEPLLEYASPFTLHYHRKYSAQEQSEESVADRSVPPLWIVTVGRDGFWPVAVRSLQSLDDDSWSNYTLKATPLAIAADRQADPPAPPHRSNRGIVPQFTHAMLILWGFLCFAPAVLFLSRYSAFGRWLSETLHLSRFLNIPGPDTKCFYLVGGTASLSVYAVAITAYSISAIETANPLRWLFLFLMSVTSFLGIAACVLLTGEILLDMSRRTPVSAATFIERFNYRGFAVPILSGVALCWVCTAWLIARWVYLAGKYPGEGVITGFRAVNLANGVSPLVPLFCLGLAAILWVFCSLRRLCFLREAMPDDPSLPATPIKPTEESCASPFFFSDSVSFSGLLTLEKKLRGILGCPTLLSSRDSRFAMALILFLALCWGAYLFFYRLVFAFEVRAFYYLLGVTFLLIVAGILSNVLRLYLVWSAILSILRRLGQLPMRDAFSRFREHNRTLPRMTLAAAPAPLTALGVSITAACDLYSTGQKSRRVLGKNDDVDRVFQHGKDLITRAKTRHQEALLDAAAGNRAGSIVKQWDAQRCLNQFTRGVEDVLVLSWNTSMADGARHERVEKARKELEAQAEEFLVSRTVHFLSHMFPQLTNLGSYSMLCLFLTLMAISSYPLQPKNPFAYFCWFIIFAFLAVVLIMAVQLNRDAVLSCLNGTEPGEIHWDAGFIGRIVFLIVVPVLGLVGVQFPDAIAQILRWIAPAGSGHP